MTANDKDTIYIDIDDEITGIIDKLQGSSGKVVALVLPKRATALQSIVNMKLLKRSADDGKKHLVLVTTESGLLPLAGAVGLHVAKTPSSRPEIPPAPAGMSDEEEQVDETDDLLTDDDDSEFTAENAGDTPVGQLAGAAAAGAVLASRPGKDGEIETVELDNAEPEAAAPAAAAAAGAKAAKPKKNKKLAVPNFDRFRMILIFGSLGLVALIVLAYIMFAVLPKATINIKTNASTVNTDINVTLSTSAKTLDESQNTVPAKQASVQKTLTGTANASGQKNNGQKATGSVTFSSSCSNGQQVIPGGTGMSSSSGKTYVTQKSVTLTGAPGLCNGSKTYTATVNITAQGQGTAYNTSGNTSFKLSKSGDSSYDSSTITTTGSADGGTDDIQTVVSQADIDSAKGKIDSSANNTAQEELNDQLSQQGLYAVAATYAAGTPATTTSANVGDPATSVTVTEVITYTMLGAKESDLNKLVENDIKTQIDTGKQGILDTGLEQNSFKLVSTTADGAKLNVQTTAEVGPDLDTDQIAKDAAGKKSNEIKTQLESNPDVTEVTVDFSPFWVNKAPKNPEKITVNIAKPTSNAN